MPDFRDPRFLLDHVAHTMAFYHPRAIDPRGGFFHFFRDDGSVYDATTRHLVSSTRFIFNYAMAYRRFGNAEYLQAAEHGLKFLRERHRNAQTGGYAWVLDGDRVADATNHCYGLAFVLLAHAHAAMAGIEAARTGIDETFTLMERKFWSPASGLYADEAAPDWSALAPYRGQNANMHACEAMLAAFDATGQARYLTRAALLAKNITVRQAALADNLVWEHYHADWTVDWDYNKDDKTNIFRPWGYQPGHLAEWAKLLLILERHAGKLTDSGWLLPRSVELFDAAMKHAWDDANGGIVYGFAPDASVCDGDKYFWVQAESLAAAALLADRTSDEEYWRWYDRIWDYCWEFFVDHQHGAWYRILTRDNRKISDEKSPAGKTDYHTMGACYEVLNVVEKPWRKDDPGRGAR
ncbi:MAG TPA: AGE family epimerase/isomerase [Burkholderiales bacterium]|nr:AGE family epimerase/isomerase [Burkholderiales bacterium]